MLTPTAPVVLMFEATEGTLNDGDRSAWIAVVDEAPEFMGRGCDEAEALMDLCEQLNTITWH